MRQIWLLLSLGLLWGCTPPHNGTDCLFPIREGRLYGYMGPQGNTVIAPQYAYTLPFSEGLGAFNVGGTTTGRNMPTDGKWGFLSKSGDVVINPKFDSPPSSAPPYVTEALGLIRHDGYRFSEGLAAVIKEGRWVYIDSSGNVVLAPEHGGRPISSARAFHNGLANVMVNGRWGYIDRAGKMTIAPQFVYSADYQGNHVLVMDQQLKWMVLNNHGERILPNYRVVSNFSGGYASLMGDMKGIPEAAGDRLKYWFTDTSGVRTPEEPQFDLVGSFGEGGLCPVLVGSEASKETYTYPGLLRAAKRVNGKWGYVTPEGKFAFSPIFDGARAFHQNLAAVKKGDYWGYMSLTTGEFVTGFEFRYAGDLNACGISKVMLGPAHNDYDGHFAWFRGDGAEIVWIEPDLPYPDLTW